MFLFDKDNQYVLYSGTAKEEEGSYRHLNDLLFILYLLKKYDIPKENILLYIDKEILGNLDTKTLNKKFKGMLFREFFEQNSTVKDIKDIFSFKRDKNKDLVFFASGHGNIDGLSNGKLKKFITPCFFEKISNFEKITFLFFTQCFSGAFHHLDTRKNICVIGASEYQNSVSVPINKFNFEFTKDINKEFAFYDNIAINPFIYMFFILVLGVDKFIQRDKKNILNLYKYLCAYALEFVKNDLEYLVDISKMNSNFLKISIPYKEIQHPYLLNKIKATEIFLKKKQKLLIVSNSSPNKINHIIDAFLNRDDLEVEVLHQYNKEIKRTFIIKVFDKLKLPLDVDNLNKRILKKVEEFKPDIIFIIKGNSVYPYTLKQIKEKYPKIKLISFSLDDMYAWHNRSIYYAIGLKYYDVVFTTKSYNIGELKQLGAKNVKFLYQAFSKKYHKPCSNCDVVKYKYNVLFIGFAERERFEYMNFLAKNGIEIHIYGSGWQKKEFKNHHLNLKIYYKDLIGEGYSNAISCSKISLCFLRKINRDLHTSRSIEIPACGGFMIAEITEEHKKLFEEDKEAVYFDTKEELLEKVKYYLEHEEERKQIAKAGYERTRKNDYSYDDMVNRILNDI